jgi:hypothetical protein
MMMKECKSRETWKRREDDSFQYDDHPSIHPSMHLQMVGRREEKENTWKCMKMNEWMIERKWYLITISHFSTWNIYIYIWY